MKEAGKQESAPIAEREPAIQAPMWRVTREPGLLTLRKSLPPSLSPLYAQSKTDSHS